MKYSEDKYSEFLAILMDTINLQIAVPKEEYEGEEDLPIILDPESQEVVGLLYDSEQAENLYTTFDCVRIFGLAIHSLMEKLLAANVPMESFVPFDMIQRVDPMMFTSEKTGISGLSPHDANALTSLEGFPYPLVCRESGEIVGWASDNEKASFLNGLEAILESMESMRDVLYDRCIAIGIDPGQEPADSN